MTDETLEKWRSLEKLLKDASKFMEERAAAQASRRAALSPAERAAEDTARARALAEAERAKLKERLGKLGEAVLTHETWTLDKFCWLLAAEDPEEPSGWTMFDTRPAKATKLHKQFRNALASCVPVTLRPVNPEVAPDRQRFAVSDLLGKAREKGLGCFDVLAELMTRHVRPALTSPPVEGATTKVPPPAQSRERSSSARRKHLSAFARELAESGEGAFTAEAVMLAINGMELNARFRRRFPQWQKVADKTLERDRAECRPPIRVAMGRPTKDE